MKIAILDATTLGEGVTLDPVSKLGECTIYQTTSPHEVADRVEDAHVVIVNKIKLSAENLHKAANLRLICLFATGYDNVDVDYCRDKGIAVCNVTGYSSHSVSQVTVAMALNLFCHLNEYSKYVEDGSYTASGVANCLTPMYRELWGKTWGLVGYGNIAKEVAAVAKALGCRVIVYRRKASDQCSVVSLDTLCRESDIISVHTPLSPETHHLINQEMLQIMKKDAVLVNTARGAVVDESAVAQAIDQGAIGAFGTDVYSREPLTEDSPIYGIRHLSNVILTPHMAWGALESRQRCIDEVAENIVSFLNKGDRNRVDM